MLKQIYRFLNPRFQQIFLDYKVDMKPRYGHGKPPHDMLYRIINDNRPAYIDLCAAIVEHREALWQIPYDAKEAELHYNNGFLPGLDIAAMYTLIAKYKPSKYIEVGSGNSTKVAHLAKQHLNLDTTIISIDPNPRAEIDHLADKVNRVPFETISEDLSVQLKAGDILFIDNSHRIFPNSDSMVFFLELLPKLATGVIVHIHDIYLPYDYPQFMCDRAYNEQYGLACFLLANPGKYKTLFPNYFVSEDKALSESLLPLWEHPSMTNVERHGGSYWLQIS